MVYKPEIDGLRAFAVTFVVLYHAYPNVFPGGFYGVDVFFVISGYLITSIIMEKQLENNFKLHKFYFSRVLRIFPALICVLVATLVFGKIIFFPDEFAGLIKHILGGILFVSNFVLWNESGYFDKNVYLKPLMHLWSLSVEEQFYIFWPFIIIFFKKTLTDVYKIVCIFILILISLAFYIGAATNHPAVAFFSPFARFWELGVGGFCAYISHASVNKTLQPFGSPLLIISSALMISSVFFPIGNDSERVYISLLPVIGAAFFLLLTSVKPRIISFFSLAPLTYVGKISYPLYLWHWPLLSFAYIYFGGEPPWVYTVMVILFSLVFSIATYKYIESPVRSGRNLNYKLSALILLWTILGLYSFYEFHSTGNVHLLTGKTL